MLNVGVIIGERYEVVSRIGSGGMADVYKAKDHKLNRFVAMKVLKPEFSADTNFIRKFQREAQAAAGLAHPNVVNVFDVGEDHGVNYIVMELVEGITLKEYISKKGKSREMLKGELPVRTDEFHGCVFHTRCPYADECCCREEPVLREVSPGHRVACHKAMEQ